MSKKQVLVLCTGNSCRSIMAEALINSYLGECIEAQSSGVKASGVVNIHAKNLLHSKNQWRESYHSKVIETLLDTPFDLIVTVCEHAKENCPVFPKAVKTVHVSFDDPSGKAVIEYEVTYNRIKEELLPVVKNMLCN